jgi:hypothetical protein
MTITTQELQAQLEALRQENEGLKKAAVNKGSAIKISGKGAVSVYGLGRFPVTLYASQWHRLFAMVDGVKAFIEANADKLATKE